MDTVTAIVICMTDAEEAFAAEALHSVQHQTVPARVRVCVADTNTWIDSVISNLRPGIEVLRMPLAPPGVVRNTALQGVDTELVAFLDGDDAWRSTKLARQLDAVRSGADVVAAKHVLVRDDGKPFFFAFARDYPMPSSWLGRTAVFRNTPFGAERVGEDVRCWDRLTAEVRCLVLDEFLLRYRVHPGSLSEGTPSMRRKRSYERRSRVAGVRPVLLAGSYAANAALRLRAVGRR